MPAMVPSTIAGPIRRMTPVFIFLFSTILIVQQWTLPPGEARVDSLHSKLTSMPKPEPLRFEYSTDGDVTFPWEDLDECSKYQTRLAEPCTMPKMALASYPGSGNTWLRFLIEGATGLFTGSDYNEGNLIMEGFRGEVAEPSCTLLQKTHGYIVDKSRETPASAELRAEMVASHGGRGVLLIRNPYEALLAFRNFQSGYLTGIARDSKFEGPEWDDYVRRGLKLWRDFNNDWIHHSSWVFVIYYENLKRDPVGEMRSLMKYLGIPEDEGRMKCLEMFPNGKFKREKHRKQIFHRRDVFLPEHHVLLGAAIASVQQQLGVRGLPPLPVQRYKYYRHPRRLPLTGAAAGRSG